MALRKPARAKTKSQPRGGTSPKAKTAASSWFGGHPVLAVGAVVGFVGLAALAATVLSSRRLREEYVRPFSEAALIPLAAAGPQTDRLWAQTRPWRDHVSRILASVNTEEVRDVIAARLSQWVERLR